MYIEREAMVKYIRSREGNFIDDMGKGWSNGMEAAASMCEKFPAADVAPVVFCRNCAAHNRCAAERIYLSEGIEAPFCCRGKRRNTDGYHTPIQIADELDAGRKFSNDPR